MALVTYPLNDVDYQGEDAELFHCTRNSGIYAGDDFSCSCTGADNTLVIGPGVGWIRNSRFSGKVIALKADRAIDMGLTDSVYPRIDAVVLQFDANSNQTEVKVKKGTPSSVPATPEISRTESIYELHLYHVYREAGAASISVADVTDLRMDANYCGLMADSVTEVNTSAINAQVMALIEKLRQDILAAKDGSAYLLRDGSVPMGGDLPMGKHRVKDVAAPEEDGDAVNLGYANENFRPNNWVPTADAVGAMEMSVLWANARVSGFPAQTLTFADNDYTHFGVVLGDLLGNCHAMIMMQVGDKGLATQLGGDTGSQSGSGLIMNRRITETTQTSMTFGDCKYVSVASGANWTELNSQLIPLLIYGIKGVQE